MDSRERFFATLDRNVVDRPASWLGLPDTLAIPSLYKYFRVKNMNELKNIIDDDIFTVEIPYHSPFSDAIYAAFDFAKKGRVVLEHRTLNSPGFFENMSEPERINDFDWPDPEKYISPDACLTAIRALPKNKIRLGIIWSAHFQDTLAAFGMENALVQMMMAPDMFKAVSERIVKFYLKANSIFFEATKGELDAVLIGNDYGAQGNLMVAPNSIREFALSGSKLIIDQAKNYGLKVIYHSCGSIYHIIPDLIKLGVDAIHPIQAKAALMEPDRLKRDFGDRVSFVGGVDAQFLLVQGSPEQIKEKVFELRSIFPTGLVISPSHEAILPDINPANIEALFWAVKQ